MTQVLGYSADNVARFATPDALECRNFLPLPKQSHFPRKIAGFHGIIRLETHSNDGVERPTLRLISEFAAVEIERDDSGNGPRLMIRDARSGQCIYLDPLELAALAWAHHDDLLPLIDPSRLDRHLRNGR